MRTVHLVVLQAQTILRRGLPTVARMFDAVGNVNEKTLAARPDLAPVSGVLHYPRDHRVPAAYC